MGECPGKRKGEEGRINCIGAKVDERGRLLKRGRKGEEWRVTGEENEEDRE